MNPILSLFNNHRRLVLVSLVVILSMLLSACGLVGTATPTATRRPTRTNTPGRTDIPAVVSSATPVPGSTAAPVLATVPPSPTLTLPPPASPTIPPPPSATVKPSATSLPPLEAEKATITAQAADMTKKIDPELRKLGLNSNSGKVVWFNTKPIEYNLTDYMQWAPYVISSTQYADFVLNTEVTWTSTTGLAGCGLLFRASEDFLESGTLYRFGIYRVVGAPGWTMEYWAYGEPKQILSQMVVNYKNMKVTVPGKANLAINDKNGSTNKLTIVAKGMEYTIYINDQKIEIIYSGAQMKGVTGFQSYQESGRTTCKFDNSWLWVFNK